MFVRSVLIIISTNTTICNNYHVLIIYEAETIKTVHDNFNKLMKNK